MDRPASISSLGTSQEFLERSRPWPNQGHHFLLPESGLSGLGGKQVRLGLYEVTCGGG